jgi:hypothetical protein
MSTSSKPQSKPAVAGQAATDAPAGKGMPARSPRAQPAQTGRQTTAGDASAESSLELPNDRDQATDMTAAAPDPKVKQASKDVKRGVTDTSKGAETDKVYSKLRKS